MSDTPLEHRITAESSAKGPARLVATAVAVQVLYDYVTEGPRAMPAVTIARLESFEGRSLRG